MVNSAVRDHVVAGVVRQIRGSLCLLGVVGSHAYGLDRPESDHDHAGVFISPLDDVLGLREVRDTYDHFKTLGIDCSVHELAKFLRLALQCNPNILDLLFLDEYEYVGEFGEELLAMRGAFLSRSQVIMRHVGYATAQIRRMNSGNLNRDAKHARHVYRLLRQAEQLVTTGEMTLRVSEEEREFMMAIGTEDFAADLAALNAKFEGEEARLFSLDSVLPEEPDFEQVNEFLLRVRKAQL